ncbi:MAG: hypothetical protein KH509_06270 [Clostridium sp.]|nr:hypothetical protein [Clostridium sp.]
MAYDVNKLLQLSHLKSLAEKVAADCAKQTDLTKLSEKVEGIIATGGEANKLEGVKVNGVALEIAEKMVNLLVATGTENGTLKVNNVDIAVAGLKALAYKAQVSETDFDTALKAAFKAKAEQSALNAVKSDVDTLKGSGAGSVDQKVTDALNEFATKVSDDKVVNTYKELVDWAAKHGGEAATMAGNITKNTQAIEAIKTLIGTLPEEAASKDIVGYIAESIAAIGIGDYAKTADMQAALAKKVDVVAGSRLMTDAEGTKLNGIAANATKVEKSNINGNVKINGAETVVYALPQDVVKGQIATSQEVTEMLNEVFSSPAA